MAARSIASLTLSFGLVSIPVKLYSATDSASGVGFNLLTPEGGRVKQQYISEATGEVVARADMKKGYEFEKGQFVVFTPDELKALEEGATHVVEIVSFVPEKSVDPLYYDKAYFIAPDKRGGKPYSLLQQAMRESERCALAKWSYKGKTRIVQIRSAEDGMVFQQLLFADEVRSLSELHIEHVAVTGTELQLALQIIDQVSEDSYDPTAYEDEEKKRILAAIDQKIAGKQIVSPAEPGMESGAEVIDLMEALRASLGRNKTKQAAPAKVAPVKKAPAAASDELASKPRRPAKRAPAKVEEAAPAKVRARK
ncbi:DNA end-binding protein Ku [Paraburkholderia sp. JPY158]|uniref:Non-homologous end joining protein Ku n=1 Tax=Paraburkholderia atlantica TaxID=2654982 RepID=A0A7W8V7R6_PARAM|nr:Ku protein [Paraburkholderia atlantica]MBB5425965.1 DNA end-binding protein Ku [Paraburkholderia atlantica]